MWSKACARLQADEQDQNRSKLDAVLGANLVSSLPFFSNSKEVNPATAIR